MLRPDRTAGGDREQRRQIDVALATLEFLDERHSHRVADDEDDLDLLILDARHDCGRIEVAHQHQPTAKREEGEQRIRRRAVHQRCGDIEGDRREILHRRTDFGKILARLAIRVATGDRLAEEVVVAPDHALRIAGGAARVQEIVLVAGPLLEILCVGHFLRIRERHDLHSASVGQIVGRRAQFVDDLADDEYRSHER